MALQGWANFYVIVGSSAGALIGLQFVVLTLIAQIPGMRDLERGTRAFSTPTIIHFGAALLLSAIVSAPWPSLAGAAVLWGGLGVAGVVYTGIVVRHMRATAYTPMFEDWLFHVLTPGAAYVLLAATALAIRKHTEGAMFGAGAAALLLLFTGIHNAWDSVVYHILLRQRKQHDHEH